MPDSKKILEINPDHALFAAMNGLFEKDEKSLVLKEYIALLYDQALLLEGSRPKDPAACTKALARLMVDGLRDAS